jgi:hypothetical protein
MFPTGYHESGKLLLGPRFGMLITSRRLSVRCLFELSRFHVALTSRICAAIECGSTPGMLVSSLSSVVRLL